jgi:hypothetical protein
VADEVETTETGEEFDADSWMENIMSDEEVDRLEDSADQAEDSDRKQQVTAKLEQEIEELRKDRERDRREREKEKFERKVTKFLESVQDGDPRKDFLWVLKGTKMENVDEAIASINELGKKANEKLAAENRAASDAVDAFAPPVQADQSERGPDESEKLWKRSNAGDTRATLRLLLDHPVGQ